MANNNYFRVQGSLETFTFDEDSPESVHAALRDARSSANRQRGVRGVPAVLVWRRTSAIPDAVSIPAVGEFLRAVN
jgi:uncharacterized alpha-E superfamily protein